MVDRIATYTQSNALSSSNMRLQSKYATTQVQSSTGLISSDYKDLSNNASLILSLEADYKAIVAQSENAQIASDRTELIYSALESLSDVGQGFFDDLSAAISGTGTQGADLAELASENLDQIVSLLNTQTSGRYLFSGSATSTAPVDLTTYTGTASAILPTTADTTYYQGNSYTQSVDLGGGLTVDYGFTADDTSVEELIRAFDLVINHESTSDPDLALTEAYSLLQSALDGISTAKAQTSQDSQMLEQYIDDSLDQLNLIDAMIVDRTEVDLAEVAVQLQELQNQLETSYSVTTTLLNLKLSDYI